MRATTQWVCSCGSVNGLAKLKCPVCGNDMPKKVRRQIYNEELTLQKKNHLRRVCEKHSNFWNRNARKLSYARTACGIFCCFLVLAFIASFYGHRYSLRMSDVGSRCEGIGISAAERAESIELQRRDEEVEINLLNRFENTSRFEEIGAFVTERAEGIELRRRDKEVEINIFKRLENASEDEINRYLKKLGELIEYRFDQISDAKERLLNYVR